MTAPQTGPVHLRTAEEIRRYFGEQAQAAMASAPMTPEEAQAIAPCVADAMDQLRHAAAGTPPQERRHVVHEQRFVVGPDFLGLHAERATGGAARRSAGASATAARAWPLRGGGGR
jgi:hypothetical protein